MDNSDFRYYKYYVGALHTRLDYDFLEDAIGYKELVDKVGMQLTPYSKLTDEQLEYIESKKEKIGDGFLVIEKKSGILNPIIFYNDNKVNARVKFTIFHEYGHYKYGDDDDNYRYETKSNFFARQLMMPTCLVMIYLKKKYSIRSLRRVFCVSIDVAEIACKQVGRRINKHGYCFDEEEIKF